VALVAQVAEQHGIALPNCTGAGTAANLALAQRLRPLADASRQLTRLLDDTITSARGDCWWSATALYTALARVANNQPEVEAALEPVVSFFARGRRSRRAAPPVPDQKP
jgi:hypothetical protein